MFFVLYKVFVKILINQKKVLFYKNLINNL